MSGRGPFVYRAGRALCRLYFRLVHHLRAEGMEHVPAEGPCIIAANHASVLDPPLLGCAIPHRVVHYLAKSELFQPPWGWLLRAVGAVPVERGKGDVGAIRRALELLRAGHVLGLFPEGTRSPDGQLQPPKRGIGFLVAKAAVPVVPAWIEGTFEAWPKGAGRPRLGRPVAVHYGEAIRPEEISARATGAQAYERVAELVMERIRVLSECCGTALS
ncbi:MAG: 1-acyl-sn-glycerol-3-phosphate acyltransferase [Kiritimatiellae bacterium]|nr:1-acyl-sn-glycerol-3-phosphate acyltransferase [Kiritimatiellia bacterium]